MSNNLVTNPQFKSWLSKHKLSEEEFLDCIKGERPQRAFFPFQSSEVLSAKILAFDDPGPKGVQCGVLLITKGSLEKQTVIFESNSVFLHCKKVDCKFSSQIRYTIFMMNCLIGIHLEHGDMAYVLKEGDKVTVETTEFTGGKEKKRIYTRVKAAIEKVSSMGYAPPSHYAQLVRFRQSSNKSL